MASLTFPRISLDTFAALLVLAGLAISPAAYAVEPASWSPPPATADSARFYILSFTNQDIASVTGQVLGVILQKPFDLDPSVQGSLSFQVEARMTRGQLLRAFEAALALRDTAIIDREGVLTLVPRASTVGLGARRRIEPASRYALAHVGKNILPAKPAPDPVRSMLVSVILALLTALGAVLAGAIIRGLNVTAGVFASPSRPTSRWRSREAVLLRLSQTMSIAPEVMDLARLTATRSGCSVERALNDMGVVSDQALVEAYVAVTGCGVWRPAEQPALTDGTALGISPEGLSRSGLVPVALRGRRLTLAASDPLDDEGIAQIAYATSLTVTILVGAPGDVRRAAQAVAAA